MDRCTTILPLNRPAQRTHQFSTYNNTADCIERGLREDGHQKWSFVVYRCSAYGGDAAWARRLEALRRYARELLGFYNGLSLLDSFELTVIDDKGAFNNASTAAVRAHFKA